MLPSRVGKQVFESNAQINSGIGTNVDFHSCESLTLKQGFGVTYHSTVTGAIKPCGTSPE